VLLGRTVECGAIDGLLDGVRDGGSGVLLVRGEAGIGKSALLDYACQRAAGFTVVTARGLESEAELAFAGLADLLRPLLGLLDHIPAPQAEALAGALALGPPVAGDRFAVAAGALSLLAAAAEEQPLLLVVDDAHWLDAASAETLRFAAHRLRVEPVTLLVAVRTGERHAFDGGRLAELVVDGLADDDAAELLRVHADDSLAAAVARKLVDHARGNPLALVEAAGTLTGEQLRGAEPLPDPLPAGRGIEAAFRRRLDALDTRARRALVVAAAAGERLDAVLGALPALGLDALDLGPAEKADLIRTTEGRLSWRHPLLRSVAYARGDPAARRDAHRALAHALAGSAPAERAWHLAAATVGVDDEVAALLEETALEARLRRGHAAAAGANERAAQLTSDRELRARRLLEAGRDYQLAGWTDRARALLDEAARDAVDPLLRADVAGQRGIVEMWGGNAREARKLLTAAAERVKAVDVGRAATLLVSVGLAAEMEGVVERTLAAARAAEALGARGGPQLDLAIGDRLFNSLVLAGKAQEAEALLERLLPALFAAESAGDDLQPAVTIGHCLVWVERHDDARRIFESKLEAARSTGSLGSIPFLTACLSELDLRSGDWDAAEAGALESVRLAEETNQRNLHTFGLVTLARVQAVKGREECRANAERALELAAELGAGSIAVYALSALGLLELGAGRVEEAVERLSRLSVLVRDVGLQEPNVVQWRPDLIEACVLSGRVDEARAELRVLEAEASATQRVWAHATAARCRGMLADDGDLGGFEEALRRHDELPAPFERARTQLRLGERLRRLRRPADAREHLRAALSSFELLRAAPWAERARAELAATGERRRRNPPDALATLTPQELRIATLVAEGETNRSIAAALFLSPKTVSYHLAKIYANLGLNSRAQLAAQVARGDLSSPAQQDSRSDSFV
jgi:DNA-binding CsgD family transcriptional regulator